MIGAEKPRGAVTVLPPDDGAQPKEDRRRLNGRPKGTPNKIGRSVREMVLEALNRAGRNLGGEDGTTYLEYISIIDPKAFANLVGKCVPLQIGVDPNSLPPVARIERVIVRPPATVTTLHVVKPDEH